MIHRHLGAIIAAVVILLVGAIALALWDLSSWLETVNAGGVL